MDRLTALERRVSALEAERPVREWYSIRTLAEELSVPYRMLADRPACQPRGGIPDYRIGRRKLWHRTSVAAWLPTAIDGLDAA